MITFIFFLISFNLSFSLSKLTSRLLSSEKGALRYLVVGEEGVAVLAFRPKNISKFSSLTPPHFKYFNKSFYPDLLLPLPHFKNLRGAI